MTFRATLSGRVATPDVGRAVGSSEGSTTSDSAYSTARSRRRACSEDPTGSTFTLIRDGIWGDAITVLANINSTSDSERREILDATKRIEREVGERLTPVERQKIKEVQTNCFDESFGGKLRRWVGKRIHADYDLEGNTGFKAADIEVQKLAELGYERGVSGDDLKWLGSE